MSSLQSALLKADISGRVAVSHCWDQEEPRYCAVLYYTVLYCTSLYCTILHCTVLYRLLVVEAKLVPGSPAMAATQPGDIR